MIKLIVKYVLVALGTAMLGIVLVIVGSTEGDSLSIAGTIGLLLFVLSPVISGFFTWFGRRKIKVVERQMFDDEAKRNMLRHRFLERQRLIDSIDRHRATLKRNIERSIKKNDYGALISDNRNDALVEFFASIDLDMVSIEFGNAKEIVFEQLELRDTLDQETGFDAGNLPFDGHAFERWVADALIGFGWEAKVTSGSGDQGIDVIATKERKKLGLQCKLYSSPIGNKAVQEAHAGKAFYQADAVGVLSNASYTSSAKDLAEVTGVKLLSHHDIPEMFSKIFE